MNYGIICWYILWTFVQLDVGFTAWGPIIEQLGFSINLLNYSAAVNYAALGVGCIFFIPFVHAYGRRPLYLFSTALQFASCIWQAEVYTGGDIIGANIVSGLGGAISETVVQITIADMFFVHQHATMNGYYILFTSIGAFLGPVASGYVVDSQGWRWVWWWCAIFLGVTLVLSCFFFEESKYVPVHSGRRGSSASAVSRDVDTAGPSKTDTTIQDSPRDSKEMEAAPGPRASIVLDSAIPLKTYWQRLALWTPSNTPIFNHFYQPIIVLFTFPAVSFAAMTFGSNLAWFAIMTSVQATYLLEPPYNFTAIGVGLMNLPPFIGTFLAFFVGGFLNDYSILWISKQKTKGVYEPESRLWMALPCAPVMTAGILMFGLGLAHGVHWILLAVGYGFFGFAFGVSSDIALSYCTDCYQDIIGDALVGVVFTRNAFSVVVLFTITPWLAGMGIQNMHILTACLAFAILSLPVLFLLYGKRFRLSTRERYRVMAMKQVTHRTF